MLALKEIPELRLTHSQIQAQVSQFLRVDGYFVFPNRQDQLSYAGISDLTAIKDGRIIWIEIKTDRDTQNPKQIKFQKDIEENDGEYRVARSIDDIEDLCEGRIKFI